MAVRLLGGGQGIPQGGVTSLLVAHNRLYVGTAERGLFAHDLDTGRTQSISRKDGLPSEHVKSLALFRGKVYVGTSEGIGVEEGSRWEIVTRVKNVNLRNVVLAVSPDGKDLWAAAVYLAGGTVRYDGKEWKFIGGEGRGLFNDVNSFGFSGDGVLMGTMSGAVYKYGADIESLKEGFPSANVFAVGERGGTFYAGTNKGLYLWRGKKWDPARVPAPFSGTAIFSILRSDVDLLIGGMKGLLLLDRRGEARILSGKGDFPPGTVTALAEDDGTIYAGTEKGVAVLKDWRE